MLEYIKKILGSRTTTLIVSNDEMEDIIKIVKSLKDSSLLSKEVSVTIQNEDVLKRRFLSILLRALDANLLGNILVTKAMNGGGEGFIRAGYGSSIKNKDF